MDPYLWKRLWRRPLLSLCSLILSGVLCFLVGYLTDYRQQQQAKLTETQESFDVLCVVTDRRGTKSTNLRMSASTASFVTGEDSPLAGLIRDVRITKEFSYACPALGISDMGSITNLTGVSNERCLDQLNPAMGAKVTYFTDDFYEKADYAVIISEQFYEEIAELEIDSLKLTVTDPCVDPNLHPGENKAMVEFQIAGYYSGRGYGMYMTYDASQALESEYFVGNYCDSIAFLAADNLKLDDISAAALAKFGAVDPMASSSSGSYALTIHDEQYRATVAALEQNIARTGYLLPIVLLLGVGVGFLISFLSTRSEKRTYALMRTMGMTRGKLFFSILREQLVLVALAAIIAYAITRESIPTIIYFVCYTVGCVTSVMKSIQVPPTAILREQE